jgi:hypothetical protein
MTTPLTGIEIEALRTLPEFQEAVVALQKAEQAERDARKAAHDARHVECPGDPNPEVSDVGLTCQKCGLMLKWRNYASKRTLEDRIKGQHWNHKDGGNPARADGLSGKSAQAADGDWYSSH